MSALDETWRKSTRSGNNGSCVEVRYVDGRVQVRDTKDRDGGTLMFTPEAWTAFIAAVRAGDNI